MSLLERVCKELDFNSGDLLSATDNPASCRKRSDWLEKGEWLSAAHRAGAKKVFFVNSNPVAVFAECGRELSDKVRAFNRAWCLARPRVLFLASPGSLTVYDLAQKPVNENNAKEWRELRHLALLSDIRNVAAELQEFHRDYLESGSLFGDERFGNLNHRADKALSRDLRTVRRELIQAGLSGDKTKFAHSLIGRSILIRYLEDRGVLDEAYFRNLAGTKAGWTELINRPASRQGVDASGHETFYPRLLADKDFAFALFRKLAKDFNGDMFPEVDKEERVVSQRHLDCLQGLLYGDAGIQKKLFFYSYRFDIVPLDLISAIYEEFYHSSVEDDAKRSRAREAGAYYTPPALAEFVLSKVLTEPALKKTPRVLDPACGSGIFLVEAFRRIVRHRWHRERRPLTFDELTAILRDQIAGIEANPEAARIAAFSLYLAMLHYLEPPAITEQIKNGNKLPNLVASTSRRPNHCHSILPENAFNTDAIESHPAWRSRFGPGCADIIVGNPPWGAPGEQSDAAAKARQAFMLEWCREHNKPISNKEASQAFLWRTVDLLRPNGKAGMIVSAGVLLKHSATSRTFREEWLKTVRLREVVNFTHVRKLFFKGAASPFVAMCFDKAEQAGHSVSYWSANEIASQKKTQAVLLSAHDLNVVRDEDLTSNVVWKTYWMGTGADRRFMNSLTRHARLRDYVDRDNAGQGYQIASGTKGADALQSLRSISQEHFSRYGSLQFTSLPDKVYRLGPVGAYRGPRVLVKRGIRQRGADKGKGRIIARYETEPFCFNESIYGLKLRSQEEWMHKTVLGVLWSSLSRYHILMTSSSWGLWHYEMHIDDELLQLPMVLEKSASATRKVIAVVDKLRNWQPKGYDIFTPGNQPREDGNRQRREWERQLDDAVFELYGLTEEHKDLIRDACDVTIPLLYRPFDSLGASPAIIGGDYSWMEQYARVFCRRWQPYLHTDEGMRAELHLGAHGNMVAVELYPADRSDPWNITPRDDSWSHILQQLSQMLPKPMGTSQIVLDGMVHAVSSHGIIIIKRNKKRLWTRSLAREDADSALARQMIDTMPQGKSSR